MTNATYLRTEDVFLDDLTPFPGNAKRGDVPLILESLRRNGQYRGLVVRVEDEGRYVVLAGNHTAEALRAHGAGDCGTTVKVGDEEHPCGVCGNVASWPLIARCEIVTCDDPTARRINLVDNRSAEKGTYDRDALAELLSYLDDDLAGSGYTDSDVELLITPPLSLEELADTYGDPEADDFWPVLRIRLSPEERDEFLALTVDSPGKEDADRLRYLMALARGDA
ncbi:ParB/Srx family N-terminal domain-containing protein [Streptomyces sp. AMCC400023]|uniref:ParB/Srx family N-terminal domain-containing protein n=1 Tax=Streptomyces sp. AMCC400023 TaxID=2056258 RepID=UPI001F41B5FF|nr:ParB/Srx family N-terminal domain-containing protein [Streptomyces sp. AMCC400023]UJV42964.1 hypothetical protein CVT30_26755 [Streptomyces sp. AMCC400023]